MIRSVSLFLMSSSVMIGNSLGQTDNNQNVMNGKVADVVHTLEQMYIDDCQTNSEPHGDYAAIFQPCNFEFRSSDIDGVFNVINGTLTACNDEYSTLIERSTPMHWIFNLTEHYQQRDWDQLTWEDIPNEEELMLWPDQCVGVVPRCYDIKDPLIQGKLTEIFQNAGGYPDSATHVKVDCRNDAVELSKLAYGVAGGFEKSSLTLMAWILTITLLSSVLTLWCCYGCCKLCCCRRKTVVKYKRIAADNDEESGDGRLYSDDSDAISKRRVF